MLPSELTNTIEQFIVYVHRNEAHVTYNSVYHTIITNVFEADNIYKDPLPNDISTTMTMLTAGALTDPQLPTIASTRVHD